MKFWNFNVKNEGTPEEEIELRIEGEIVSDDDAWIYEWFGIPAASPNAFREELKQYAGKHVKVWIDSFGGDVFAGVGLYNALKEHKEHGGKITTIADGKVMSAAVMPFEAGEEAFMTPGAIVMIHNPWTWIAGEAKDMIHTANVLEELKESIINIYQTKTKRSHKKISEMMDNETWMSAKTAIAEGFADKMLYADTETDAGTIENSLMFGRLAIQNSITASMKKTLEAMKKIKPEAFKDPAPTPPPNPEPPQYDPPQQTENKGLLFLMQQKVQVNKNKIINRR
jgi:ATP-dependent Clp protease protease subunit